LSTEFRSSPIATNKPTNIVFAAQSDPAESNLTPFSADQLKSLGEVADVIKWNGQGETLKPQLTTARVGRELWLPLLIAALVLATLETFMAQNFTKSK
jgi:hypothetical protein